MGKSWAELPAANTSVTEICHYITDVAAGNGSYPRNFAMGYDKAKKAALWAAYPLHAYYTAPNASKERAYSADPSLGKTEQMVGGVGAPYNKGHQVPNADRKVSNLANKQISYYSNMTPQLATFNSGAWGTLETRVRGWMCADTLYVVTGCYFDGTEGTTTDNGGNPCPVPTHYYKVLLRTKQGTTGQSVTTLAADELQCIGFWYEQTTDKTQTPDGCAVPAKEKRPLHSRGRFSLYPGDNRVERTDDANRQKTRKKQLKYPGHSSGKPRTPISAPKGKACGRYNSGSGTAASRAP